MRLGPHASGQFGQSIRVGTVRRTDDQHQFTVGREFLHRVLAVLRRVADIIAARTANLGKAHAQRVDHRTCIVDRQRGLRDIGKRCGVAHLQRGDLLDAFHQIDIAPVGRVELPHRAFHLRVSGVSDQHTFMPLAAVARNFHVHLGDQRTGGIEHPEPTVLGLEPYRLRHTVCAEDHDRAIGHFVEFIDEHCTTLAQIIDHETVVHHLVAHVDRCAENLEGTIDDLDRTIDTGTEAARIGQPNAHRRNPPHRRTARRSPSGSPRW